jgi:hypothetical protein
MRDKQGFEERGVFFHTPQRLEPPLNKPDELFTKPSGNADSRIRHRVTHISYQITHKRQNGADQ